MCVEREKKGRRKYREKEKIKYDMLIPRAGS
jgi:hypothetical protein